MQYCGLSVLSFSLLVLGTGTGYSQEEYFGEVIPRPDLIVKVTANMWGKIYLEEGVYEGASVKKEQPLARTVLELPANERLPLNDRTIDIKEHLEIVKEKLFS